MIGTLKSFSPPRNKRRRLDSIGVKERIRHLQIRLGCFPRQADFVLPLDDVLVEAVQPELHGAASAADRGLETLIGRNRVVCGNPAVAPPADSQPIRISNALSNGFVNRTEQIHYLEVAPVGVNGFLIRVSTTRAASVIDRQHDVPLRRQQLAIEAERMLVLRIRSTVDDEQRWISLSGLNPAGLTIRPCTSAPSLLFDVKSSVVANCNSPTTRSLCLVSLRSAPFLQRVNLCRLGRRCRQHSKVSVLARAERAN